MDRQERSLFVEEDYGHGAQPFVPITDPSFISSEAIAEGGDYEEIEEAERMGLNPLKGVNCAPFGWIGLMADYEAEGENDSAHALTERNGCRAREEFVENILEPSEVDFELTDEERDARRQSKNRQVEAGCRLIKKLGLDLTGNKKAICEIVGIYVQKQMEGVVEHVVKNLGGDMLEAAADFAEKMASYKPKVSLRAKRQLTKRRAKALGRPAELLNRFGLALGVAATPN